MKNVISPSQNGKYDVLIRKIQRKRKLTIIFTVIAIIVTLILCSPMEITVLGKTVFIKEAHPVIAGVVIVLSLIIELISIGSALMPITQSMETECDPEKSIVLNQKFNKQKNLDSILAMDYFYLGEFDKAFLHINNALKSNNRILVAVGWFNKARCEFFAGDMANSSASLAQFKNAWHSIEKIRPKDKEQYEKMQKALELQAAIATGDKEKIAACYNIEPWGKALATRGYVHCLKGIAACYLEDKNGAIYHLMGVKETCPKTFLPSIADKYLSNLK